MADSESFNQTLNDESISTYSVVNSIKFVVVVVVTVVGISSHRS